MALSSLCELVSVTDNVVKSMKDVTAFREVGSPFESPRSLLSSSDSGVDKTKSRSEPSFPRGIESKHKKVNEGKSLVKDCKHDGMAKTLSCQNSANKLKKDCQNEQNMNRNNSIPMVERIDGSDRNGKTVRVQRFDNTGTIMELKEKLLDDSNTKLSGSEEGDEMCSFSGESNQPHIINVVSHDVDTLRSSFATGSSDSSTRSRDDVPHVNDPNNDVQYFHHKSFGKTLNSNVNCQSLKQGDLSKGVLDPTKSKVFDDVFISQFQLTDKQRDLKEALAKRSENNQPKRKQVQPQVIHCNNSTSGDNSDREQKHATSESNHGRSKNNNNPVSDSAVTAAVAASAAVAATQPFLKIQENLESQIKEIVSQLADIQKGKSFINSEEKYFENGDVKTASGKRISDLERQVTELNERRLEHIESLQQQQFQMQAQLLMMSRSKSPRIDLYTAKQNKSPTRNVNYGSHIPRPVAREGKTDHASSGQSFSSHAHHRESALGQSQSSLFNPDALSKHHNYLSEVRELQGSLLDTPAPRRNVPQPTPYTLPEEQHKNLGFLQELLDKKDTPSHDTTFNVPPRYDRNRNNSSRPNSRLDKSPVDQVRRLMSSLSNLEKETADNIWGSRENLTNKMIDLNQGPAPLDQYLKYPETKSSPYPTLDDVKKEKRHKRPNLDDILEAKKVLRHLEVTRETLEKNIEQVVRTSRDMHVFSALLNNGADGVNTDHGRIERMVRKKIASLNDDVQREVLRGLAEEEANKAIAEAELARMKTALKKNPGRSVTTKSTTMKQLGDYSTKMSYGKMLPTSVKTMKPTISKVKQPPKPSVIKDEKTMTRTYGKPEYQRGRTTIRDPYMHFTNSKKGRPVTINESMMSRDGMSKSPKRTTQGSPVRASQAPPQQYFFSPTRGYIPLTGYQSGPVTGEMVPMAIPLGQPRMEPGMRSSAKPMTTLSNPITSTPVPVTAETNNAAVISFLMDAQKQKQKETKEPELSKQVLPPIDIDSISPSSSRITDVQISTPQQGNPNVTFLQQTHDSDLNKTLTDGETSDDEQGEGIQFPGYEPKVQEYTGPDFPPQLSQRDRIQGDKPAGQTQLMSNVMAEDLRRKDLLENNAINWLEQELMARVLTEVMPLQIHQVGAGPDVTEDPAEKSEMSDKEESLLVADMIGQGGLQLFIDCGQPVDNRLVNALIAEVIQEKINTMLANKGDEVKDTRLEDGQRGRTVTGSDDEERRQTTSTMPRVVPTPEPTPKSSPVASPRRMKSQPQITAPTTPPLSPPPDGFSFKPRPIEHQQVDIDESRQVQVQPTPAVLGPEPTISSIPVDPESDSDITVSVDISEELRRVSAQGKSSMQSTIPAQSCHDVATPPMSPLPEKEEESKPFFPPQPQATPPASPPPSHPDPVIIRPSTPPPAQKKVESPPQTVEEDEEEEEEQEEEEQLEQPEIIMMSVAVGDDAPMMLSSEIQNRRRSPSPKREVRVQHSPTPDSVLSEESSMSDTANENISEGQWLLSRSEGQIVGMPMKVDIHDLKRGYQQMVDLSTASTLHGTEDLEMDTVGTVSEGEVMVSGVPAPEQDPMLELLIQMQKNPRLAAQMDIPDSQIAQMIESSAMRNNITGRSLGEVSLGQVAPSRVIKVQSRQTGERRQQRGRGSPLHTATSLDRSETEDYSFDDHRQKRGKSSSHQHVQSSRHRDPEQRSSTPPHHRDVDQRSPTPPRHRQQQQQQQQESSRDQRRSRTPEHSSGPRSPSPRAPAYRADPRDRSRRQMQYQPVLSEGAPISTRRQVQSSYRNTRRSSDTYNRSHSADRGIKYSRESATDEPYTSNAYSTDQMTHSLDSASYRRSGEGGLTSSLKSRQSGVKKSVEFDLTGTYERRETARSSVTASRDSSRSVGSLGLDYSQSYDDSIDDSELKRIMGEASSHNGPYRMSVTLPSTLGDDSDISDLN